RTPAPLGNVFATSSSRIGNGTRISPSPRAGGVADPASAMIRMVSILVQNLSSKRRKVVGRHGCEPLLIEDPPSTVASGNWLVGGDIHEVIIRSGVRGKESVLLTEAAATSARSRSLLCPPIDSPTRPLSFQRIQDVLRRLSFDRQTDRSDRRTQVRS